jgi:hypothetical protein
VIAVTLADLFFRARQFVIALAGVALVMAMALLLTGYTVRAFRQRTSARPQAGQTTAAPDPPPS